METEILINIAAYDILQFMHPEENVFELGERLFANKKELNEIFQFSLQRIAPGFFCEDLRDYRSRLFVSMGYGEARNNYHREQILEAVEKDPRAKKLCEIFGLNPEEIRK